MPLNTGKKSHKRLLSYRILTENKIRKKQMITQKLITFKTANEALYIGRLLPKNRENEKSAKIEVYHCKTKTKKLFLLLYDKNDQNKRKFITRAKI